jgi:O-antigen ligase
MNQVAIKSIAPLYVFACLILGGSNHGIWLSAVLQIGAILVIGLVITTMTSQRLTGASRSLFVLVVAALLLVLLQLVPLPPAFWTHLPGRSPIREGYETLGLALPWLPLSLTPHDTLYAVTFALPFLAVLLATVLLRETEPRWIVTALILGTFAGVALGAVQSAGGEAWKLYSITNTGAVGFFANRNFFGTLLVLNIPFAAALIGSEKFTVTRSGATLKVLGAAYLLVIVIGIVLNRSLAAALIAIPVSAASLGLLPFKPAWKWSAIALGVALAIGLAAVLMSTPLKSAIVSADAVSIQTRMSIWSQTLKIIGDTLPFGTGLGSFREVYAFHEDPALIDRWYVNNAHNDYLELVLELGLPGIVLIGGFFVWWLVEVRRVWRSTQVDLIARAATIASAAVLAHSFADYPLRTAAISSILGFCLGVMAISGAASARPAHPTQRDMRHVRIA